MFDRLRSWAKDPLGWRRALANEARSRELLASDCSRTFNADAARVTALEARVAKLEEDNGQLVELAQRHSKILTTHKAGLDAHEGRLHNHMMTMKRMTPAEALRFRKAHEAQAKKIAKEVAAQMIGAIEAGKDEAVPEAGTPPALTLSDGGATDAGVDGDAGGEGAPAAG